MKKTAKKLSYNSPRVSELSINPNVRPIQDIFKDWQKKFAYLPESSFMIFDLDTKNELNSELVMMYAFNENGKEKVHFGHLRLHLRKGFWWFSSEEGFHASNVFVEQYETKNKEWYKTIENLLFIA